MIPASFYDLASIGQVALVVALLVQYVKDNIPEWLIKPYLQIFLGVLLYWAPSGQIFGVDWINVIVNGGLAGIFADGGYKLLSASKSPLFSLPSRKD